jgi:hypothetical protein
MTNQITLTEVKDLSLLGAQVVQAMQTMSESPRRILKFDGAVLARKESNKNHDAISADNLLELAATLPLNWIDIGHDTHRRVGFYISAESKDDALVTGGIIWTDDDPAIPQKLASGELQFSIEADADIAKCSVCGKEFKSEKQYCEHLAPLENRLRYNAVRQLFGMKATGGALVTRPAGTDTRADPNLLHMIAMALDRTTVAPPPQVITFLSEMEYRLFKATAKTLDTQDRKDLEDSQFALIQKRDGKTVRRFPINDCNHARNALARLGQAKDLSDDERAQVKRKAEAKLNSPECKRDKTNARAYAVLSAQRFFAMEYANTPTIENGGTRWYHPVISPLLYHAEPELQAAPVGKHPVSPVQQVAEQAAQAVQQKIEASTQVTAADQRVGSLSMSWLRPIQSTPRDTVVWVKK